ncbi:hypothetical protein E1258_04195 [Micromonospora sp. KC207]|uniref:hypothetical protein n=1 Tax=Micromonospora sp. KC207 TaxID=2530377 RepID=UPI0010D83CC4|nr:hypothetical protein [Micromonospora sp. KC207]TDC65973.1 hypothetical protein E1258_04195 [Micromonospora sp. KC207]
MVDKVVLFVCEHGAGRSRLAAAWFDGLSIDGWTATSAGMEPQAQVSAHAARLLVGTPVEGLLDAAPPRSLSAVPAPDVIVAIDCPGSVPGAVRWTLEHQEFSEAMSEEIRERAATLVRSLNAGDRP